MKQRLILFSMISAIGVSPPVLSEISVNGFATVALGVADDDHGFLGYDKDPDAQQDSLVGLQFNFPVNEKVGATVQLLSKGSNDWDSDIEWAYLSYNMDNGTTLRAGKLRLPIYSYSDYLDVGYARTFLRAPQVVYEIVTFSAYNGVDAIIPLDMNDSTLTLQPFYGSVEEVGNLGNFEMNNLIGLNATWEWNSFTARGIYAYAELDGDNPLLQKKDSSFSGLSAQYDNGSWFIMAEYAMTEIDDQASDNDAGYIGAGVHLGDFTPYVVLGMAETQDNDERASIPLLEPLTYERKEYSVGLRWDCMPSVALTADLTIQDDFNSTGGFSGVPAGEFKDGNIFTIAASAVF